MYRLKKPEDAYELGIEEAFFSGVCLIEWPEKLGYLLPRKSWKISIQTNGSERIFVIEANSLEDIKRLEEALDD